MTLIQVGLVDTTRKLDSALVQAAAAALNVQVTRDLPQFWNVQATVIYLPDATKIPAGVWPVQLVNQLPQGEGGVHLNKHNQPYAKVIVSDGWTIDASHETIEMLVDPSGNRLQSAQAIEIVDGKIQDGTGQFEYLVEACDPCEADAYGYPIQGIAVSDFITPHFYDVAETPGTRYSFTGAIKTPRQVLPGGYISYVNLETDEWQQILWVDTSRGPVLNPPGQPSGRSLREWIDAKMAEKSDLRNSLLNARASAKDGVLARAAEHRQKLEAIAIAQVKLYP